MWPKDSWNLYSYIILLSGSRFYLGYLGGGFKFFIRQRKQLGFRVGLGARTNAAS